MPTSQIAFDPGYSGYTKPSPTVAAVVQPTQSPAPGTASPTPTPSRLPETGTSSLLPLAIISGLLLVVCGIVALVVVARLRRQVRDAHGGSRHGLRP